MAPWRAEFFKKEHDKHPHRTVIIDASNGAMAAAKAEAQRGNDERVDVIRTLLANHKHEPAT